MTSKLTHANENIVLINGFQYLMTGHIFQKVTNIILYFYKYKCWKKVEMKMFSPWCVNKLR